MPRLPFLFGLLALIAVAAPPPDRAQLDPLSLAAAKASLPLFREMLALPNDAHDREQIKANVAWLDRQFTQRGFTTKLLPTNGAPLLLAERRIDGPAKTLLLYAHADGQPIERSQWQQPDPYQAVLKERAPAGWQTIPWSKLDGPWDPEWRIFGRSASDDKGPIAMLLAALDAMAAAQLPQAFHAKVIIDFEEEIGSPHLASAVDQARPDLAADALLIFDGPEHLSNQPTLTFGCRGLLDIRLTVFGPRGPLHSGHYGNYAPNPAFRLAKILAAMKDDDGRVAIPGFYDGVTLDESTLATLAAVPDNPAQIKQTIGIAREEKVGRNYQEALQYPSLNIRGMQSAFIGDKAGTVVPMKAEAWIDVRLVPGVDPDHLAALIRNFVKAQGYTLINGDPTEEQRLTIDKLAMVQSRTNYLGFVTELNAPVGQWLTSTLGRAAGKDPIRMRLLGGSVPIAPFIDALKIPAVNIPLVNADNNQHAANENLRLGNYIEGIRTWMAILTSPPSF